MPDTSAQVLQQQYRSDPTAPTQEAEVYDLTKRTRLPSQSVRSNVQKAKQVADEPDWDALERESPNLAKKLASNPDLFRVAKGSIEELSTLSQSIVTLGASLKSGAIHLAASAFRSPEMVARNLKLFDEQNPFRKLMPPDWEPSDSLAFLKLGDKAIEFSSTVARAIDERQEILAEDSDVAQLMSEKGREANEATMLAINEGDFGPLAEVLTDPVALSTFIGQGGASLVVALMSRGNMLPVMFMEAGETASEIAKIERETGVKISDEDYAQATIMKGFIGGFLENLGAKGFDFELGKGLASALARVLKTAGGEAGTEFGQALTGNVAKLLTYDPESNPAEDLVSSTVAGFGLGLGVQGTTEGVNATRIAMQAASDKKFAKRQQQMDKADATKVLVDTLLKQARESQLRGLSPDAFEEVVETMLEGSGIEDVYFDAQTLLDYYEAQGVLIEDALPADILKQVDEVIATGGGDVVVPLATVTKHMLDRPEDAGISEHIRFDADAMSKAEADSYRQGGQQEEFAEEANRILKENADDEAFVSEVKQIEDGVFAQMEQANRFKSDVNRTYATFAANFYTVMAERTAMSPTELAKRYPFDVNSVTAKGPALTLFKQLDEDAFEIDRNATDTSFIIRGKDDTGADVARVEMETRGDNVMQIISAEVQPDARQQQVGQQLIMEAYRLATEQNRRLVSDVAVSALQLRAYAALARKGWTIEYNDPQRVAEILQLASDAEAQGKPIAAIGVGSTVAEEPVVRRIEAPESFFQKQRQNRGKIALYAGEQVSRDAQPEREVVIPESLVSIIPTKPEVTTASKNQGDKLVVSSEWVADVHRRLKENYPQLSNSIIENGILDNEGMSGFFINIAQSKRDRNKNVGVQNLNAYLATVDALISKYEMVPGEAPESFFQDDANAKPLARAQKNNIGLFSAVEQAVIDMKLQEWNQKRANKLFTEEDAAELQQLQEKIFIDRLAAREAVFPAEEQADRIVIADQMRLLLAVTHFYQGATDEEIANPLLEREGGGWGKDVLQLVANGMSETEAKTKHHELSDKYAEYERKGVLANRAEEDFDVSDTPDHRKLAKLEERKRAKEGGGLASGKVIWTKLTKMPGVKKEELETLGLEAFLMSGDKFTRGYVQQFVVSNGVEIEEVIGSNTNPYDEERVDENEITWNESIDDDSSNWEHYVDDYISEFDRIDPVSNYSNIGPAFHFFDMDAWIDNHREEILEALEITDKRLPGQTDMLAQDGGIGDIGAVDDIQSLLLTAIEYEDELGIPDVEETVRKLMRTEFEEAAEAAAEEEYLENPYITYSSPEISPEIYGNDDVGYSINGEYHDIYSLGEAQIQAIDIARENDELNYDDEYDSDDPERARWAEYVYERSDAENYVERKLTLPNNPGAQFYEDAHFPDANIVTFLRETDRNLAVSSELRQVTPTIIEQEKSGQVFIGGKPKYMDAGFYIVDQFDDGTWDSRSTKFDTKEKAEARLRHWQAKKIKQLVNTRMVDEQQSDWHQAGRQVGYKDTDLDLDALMTKVNQLSTIVDNDLKALYQKVVKLAASEQEEGVTFTGDAQQNSGALLIPVADGSGDELSYRAESIGQHAFTQYAWGILRESPTSVNALRRDISTPIGINQIASIRFINNMMQKHLAGNDLRVLKTLAKEHDETDAIVTAQREGVSAVPFRGNAWLELGLRRAIIDAVESGADAFAWANAEMLVDRWSDRYRGLYEMQYDNKMPSIVKKIFKQKPVHLTWDGQEQPAPPAPPKISIKEISQAELDDITMPASVRQNLVAGAYYWELDFNDGERVVSSKTASRGQFMNEEGAREAAKTFIKQDRSNDGEIGYWIVPITEEFRERIKADGLPLFQDKTRGAFTPSTNTITLLEDANLSTFLHEFGHWQLEVMADLASEHGGSPEIKQDMQHILNWFGIENVNAWNKMTLEEKRPHHEKFARGFEKYLFTGRAPNSKLADIFSRIRTWMIRTYKSIKDLGVTLTPEVTGVFDRLVATEAQIREAEELQGYRQLFKSEEESGMTPAEWRKYQAEAEKPSADAQRDLQDRALRDMQWLRNARSRELKKLQAKAKGKRAEIREEVEAEVMAEPIQQAIRFLKTGELTVPGNEEVKVDQGASLGNSRVARDVPGHGIGQSRLAGTADRSLRVAWQGRIAPAGSGRDIWFRVC